MDRKQGWTEDDLRNYIGVHESVRLDFKDSRLMDGSDSKIAETLSKEISAFANTEGGVIVIGIKERREGKSRIADRLDDGIDPNRMSAEQFQQLIEGNVSPYLRGVRFHRVKLSEARTGRIAIVIDVPVGTTAYQASDKKYYGRSEYESVPLPDHEIRLLMTRGRVASAAVGITHCFIRPAEHIWELLQAEYQVKKQEANQLPLPQRREVKPPDQPNFNEWTFHLTIANTGEVTIRDFLLLVRIETHLRVVLFNRNFNRLEKFRFQAPTLRAPAASCGGPLSWDK